MNITLQRQQPYKALDTLFGIFFEDLNHAADGGLYAELLQNRDFEFDAMDRPDYHALTAWGTIGNAKITVCSQEPPYANNPHYAAVSGKTGFGLCNLGYGSGIPARAGNVYHLALTARSAQSVSIRCALADAECVIRLSPQWQRYEADLTPVAGGMHARLLLALEETGAFELAFASLMPADTWPGKANMLRRDIVQALADMKPKFLRFPGGCLTHDGDLDPDARDGIYNWKRTLGPVENRPARRNNWGYHQTMGLGFYEYFLLCEDLGCEPLPVVNGGLDPHHERFAQGERLEQYIQDAVDLIEFAKGGEDTPWGRVRAQMGHPEPFRLRYLAIGNEELHEEFHQNMALFARAVRQKDASIELIGSAGPFVHGKPYEMGWAYARAQRLEYVDEHYYLAPEWLLANQDHYAAYPSDGAKVFLGEYASCGNQMENVLAEAAYMVGLQNAPAVAMACYAPLLCHTQYTNWSPDLLYFDNARLLKTGNYCLQSMFMRHQGDQAIPVVATDNDARPPVLRDIAGRLSILCDHADVCLTHIRLITQSGEIECPDACLSGTESLEIARHDGDFRLELCMKRTSGRKGILIRFGEQNDTYYQWVVGGWQGADSAIDMRINGRGARLTQSNLSLDNEHVYSLALSLKDHEMVTALDGVECNRVEERPLRVKPLYLAASTESSTGDCILKAVNIQDAAVTAQIPCQPGTVLIESLSAERTAENSFESPDQIQPVVTSERVADALKHTFPPRSVTVLRFRQTRL